MKVAILHPWFMFRGGGERVIDVFAELYPQADIFALFVNEKMLSPILHKRGVHASVIDAIPFSAKLRHHLMPLYPWAVESFDLKKYDLVISSCGPAMMCGAIREDAVHVCYCHSPSRVAWDLYTDHQARMPALMRMPFVTAAAYIRMWEFSAMQRVDYVIANSNYIADRIHKYFRRDSTVIYPPVRMGTTSDVTALKGEYYLAVGRLVTEKKVEVLIEACNKLKRRLVIAGTGKYENHLKSLAGPTIEFLGYVPDEAIPEMYAKARAFLFAALEDFGIAPVEAQSYGLPVIAYGRGGSLETVRVNDPNGRPDTGLFFPAQTADSLADAILRFEQIESTFSPTEIQHHARQFDTDAFAATFTKFVDEAVAHGSSLRGRS